MKNPVTKNMIMGETGFKPTSKIHKPGRKIVEDYTNDTYLTGMPQHLEMYGFCKTLLVRRELIHIKHIFTEIFIRKTIDINKILSIFDKDLFWFMETLTTRVRHIFNLPRDYRHDLDKIVKTENHSFFESLYLRSNLNNLIILDYDGIVTNKNFHELYRLCLERCRTFVCSANPNIGPEYFIKHNLPLPIETYSMKGKKAKLNQIIELNKKYDNVFYIDDEEMYLEAAWVFGIKTFKFEHGKIKLFTLKSQ